MNRNGYVSNKELLALAKSKISDHDGVAKERQAAYARGMETMYELTTGSLSMCELLEKAKKAILGISREVQTESVMEYAESVLGEIENAIESFKARC